MDEDLMALLEGQMRSEAKSKRLLETTVDEVDYLPIKFVLLNVLLDTEKHERLLRNIVMHLSRDFEIPSREGYERQVEAVREAMEEHIVIELEMSRLVAEEMRITRSRLLRTLLGAVLEEE